MFAVKRLRSLWLLLTCGILVSNWMLYQTSFGNNMLPAETQAVVFGSVLDFMLFLPLSIMLYRQQFSVKTFIALAAANRHAYLVFTENFSGRETKLVACAIFVYRCDSTSRKTTPAHSSDLFRNAHAVLCACKLENAGARWHYDV